MHQVYGTCSIHQTDHGCVDSLEGPIVRITPREIHVKDPHFYDDIYTSARKCNKDPNFVGMFGSPTSYDRNRRPWASPVPSGNIEQFLFQALDQSYVTPYQEKSAETHGAAPGVLPDRH